MTRRLGLALLLLGGCRLSPSPPAAEAGPPPALAEAPQTPVDGDAPRGVPAPLPARDSLGLRADGGRLPADDFRARAAAADTSRLPGYGVFVGAGDFHGDEAPASDGEVWQAVYPTASGAEVRTVRLRVETVQDVLLDPNAGPFTGRRVTTPFSVVHEDGGGVEDDGIVFVRREAGPFPTGPVSVGARDVELRTPGAHVLDLGGARYTLRVDAGPERADGQRDRVVTLVAPGGVRQPLAVLRDGDDASPSLVWAGDLDGDGRVDLVLDETWHYNLSAPTLYLSSEAAPGALVRRVAIHETTGC